MKILYFLILYLLTFSIVQAQWVNQNPVPNGNNLRSVFFIHDSIGWIAGSDGFILKTTNTGVEWIQQNSGTTAYLKDVKFVDEQTGWLVGDSGTILKTTTGGSNWNTQFSGTTNDLYSLYFINYTTGWAVGWEGTILKTTNGGTTWIFQNISSKYDLFSVCFVDSSTGWTVGVTNADTYPSETDSSIILKTTNGGQTWVKKGEDLNSGNPTIGLLTVDFVDAANGFIGGGGYSSQSGENLFRTTDGGENWTSIPFLLNMHPDKMSENDCGYQGVRKIFFKDAANGCIVIGTNGYYTGIEVTTDGGENWASKYSHPEQFDLFSVFVTNAGTGWSVGSNGQIFITEDNGGNWRQQFSGGTISPGEEDIYDIYSVNDNIGWAVGMRGDFMSGQSLILKTTNAGKIWFTQYCATGDPIKKIYFIDESIGWAAGNDDGIYFTTDGGENWNKNSNGISRISDIFFINQDTGWAAGNGIYKSTDGGITWVEKSSIGSTSIYFSDINDGWSVGYDGDISKSTDKGETWISKMSGTTNNLNCIKFYDSKLGMIVGNTGTVLLSTDGGESWTSKNSGTREKLKSVTFTNSTSAWIAGNNGTILQTTDLGNNWTPYVGVTLNDLTTIDFVNENTGWIGGLNGTIFKYQKDILPVELVSFTSKVEDNKVTLSWQTATEQNNYGFDIERKIDSRQPAESEVSPNGGSSVGNGASWEKLGFVEGYGNSSLPRSYSFTDDNTTGGSKFDYRLKQIDSDGSYKYSEEIQAEILPAKFALYQNFPNPFNPVTKIRYQLPRESNVEIKIYNILGAEITTLLNEKRAAGIYEIEFNASNLASGIYLYRIRAGSFVETRKMILLK